MKKLVIWLNAILFVTAFSLEMTGFGLITRYREGSMYSNLEITGLSGLLVILYFVFFFFLPALNLVELIKGVVWISNNK